MGNRNTFPVSFLTWNIYIGADVSPLIANPTPEVVTEVLRQFLATNFPIRAQAIADEITSQKTDIIGLQEVEQIVIQIEEFGDVIFDFATILLNALKERGLRYEAVAQNKNFTGQVLDSNGNTIRFLDSDVILIRKELTPKVINKQEANFVNNLRVGPFVSTRGWSSIDVRWGTRIFRVINTHLEPLDEEIRDLQAQEILNGPANTTLPVVIIGDMNGVPGSSTYDLFISSGFLDVWSEVGEGLGFTSHQNPDLLNNNSELSSRIDYIFFKNGWVSLGADVVGEEQSDRTPTGLWPSDHAGVFATLKLDKLQ